MKAPISVFIIDSRTVFRALLIEELEKHEEYTVIAVVENGKEALEKISLHKPDVVIMDLLLSDMDGLGVLKQKAQMNFEKPPKIVVASSLGDDMMVRAVMAYDVDLYFVKPFEIGYMLHRISDLFKEASLQKMRMYKRKKWSVQAKRYKIFLAEQHTTKQSIFAPTKSTRSDFLEMELIALLREVGIPAHMSGYRYLKEAILQNLERQPTQPFVLKDLYERVAQKCFTTTLKVDRSIRTSINRAWLKENHDRMDSLFGYHEVNASNKPTSAEFIATMTENMRGISQIWNGYPLKLRNK